MEIKTLFDSKKYIRKVPVIISVYDGNGNATEHITLEFSRVALYSSLYYKRIMITTPESVVSDTLNELQNDLLNKKKTTGEKSYISFNIKPKGIENKDTIVCFIDNVFTYIEEYSTKSKEKVFTTYINDETFMIINNNKITDKVYDECITECNQISEEELKFINNAMILQNNSAWFPSQEELKTTKKENEKQKKIIEKKEKGGFFSKKKKPIKEVEIVAENGEYINPKSLKIHKGSSNPDGELNNIIGLDNVKKDIQKMKYMLEYEQNRKERGIESHDETTLHMCFMGHPGTGKTTIARIMTGIMFSMGYIKNNQCIEVSGLDLQGGYVGQTAIITKQIVDSAKGGILFIDEAYALCENKENSYGKEAISVLLKEMEDNRGDLLVIFAGYEDDMNKFLNVNPGFRSRINKYFSFNDYTTTELGEIFLNYIKKMHLKIDRPAFTKCIEVFKEAKKIPNFSNGRFVRNLAEKIEEIHILKTINQSDERMDTITEEDIPDTLIKDILYGI